MLIMFKHVTILPKVQVRKIKYDIAKNDKLKLLGIN